MIDNKQILFSMLDGYILADSDGNLIDVNPAYCSMTGYSRDELLKMNIRELEVTLSPEEIDRRSKKMVEKGNDRFKTKHKRKDGSIIDLEVSIVILQQKTNPLVAVFVRNVTESKSSEYELFISELKYRKLMESANDAILIADAETGILLEANKRAEEMLGIPAEKIVGMHQSEIHPKDEKEKAAQIFKNQIREGQAIAELLHVKNKSGDKVPVEISTSVMKFGDQKIIQGIFRDITERKKAETLLLSSQEKYRAVVEQSITGISISQDGKFVYANPRLAEMFGYGQEEIIGTKVLNVVVESDRDMVRENFRKRLSGEVHSMHYTFRGLKKDGTEIDIEVHGSIMMYEGRLAVIGTLMDITGQKQAEDALLQSQERMKLALEGTDQGLWDWDVSTGEITFDDNWQKILGYEHGELQFDFNWWEKNIHPDSKPVFEKALNAYLSGKSKYYELEYQLKNKSGDWMWTWARGICTEFDKNNKPLRMIGTHRDITESKKANIALEESESKYRDIFDNVKDGICVVDLSGKIVISNPECAKMFGYQLDETIGKYSGDLVHPDDRQRVMNIQKIRLSGKEVPTVYEFLGVKKNGEAINIEINTDRFMIGDKLFGTRAILRDITKRKKAEDQLREAHKELRMRAREFEESNIALKVLLNQRDKDRNEFEENILSNIKHLILPYIEKLKKNRAMSEDLAYLNVIESNLKEIISPFATRLSSKHIGLTPKETQIANLIKDGMQDKEIAEIMDISAVTVKSHRQNIRKKLGIYGKKENLRKFLMSFEK